MEGRLSTAFQTGAPANGGVYGYDAFGRLASRTVTQSVSPLTVTTLYIHDINDHIIAETDTTGATLREYIWLYDLPVAVVDQVNTASPQVYYVHTDHLGRPARMVAQNWAWAWDVIYSPFGDTSYLWNATGTSAEGSPAAPAGARSTPLAAIRRRPMFSCSSRPRTSSASIPAARRRRRSVSN